MNSKMKKENITAVTNMIILDVEGLSTAIIELTGTFIATLAFEYTINGDDWIALTANVQGLSSTATTATATGKWKADVSGAQQIRVRCTAFTSGTVEVLLRAIPSNTLPDRIIGVLVPSKVALARTVDATISTSTEITLNAATSFIRVYAKTQDVYLKYGTDDVTSANFDEVIPAGQICDFYIPAGVTAINLIEAAASASVIVIEK